MIPNVELAAFWSTITPDLDVERPNWKLCPRLPFRAGSQLYLLVCKSTFRLSCSCSFCFKSILCSMAIGCTPPDSIASPHPERKHSFRTGGKRLPVYISFFSSYNLSFILIRVNSCAPDFIGCGQSFLNLDLDTVGQTYLTGCFSKTCSGCSCLTN